jgi:ABC-type uncharacterized transport system permease subunit
MGDMMNPNMMGGMLKQNLQGVFNISLFSILGSLFSGFVIAKMPFFLGQNFKSMLQQGVKLTNLDPSYVSSMSWCFLCIFGLQGLLQLILKDSTGFDEMEMMMPGAGGMMGGAGGKPGAANPMGGGKNYN